MAITYKQLTASDLAQLKQLNQVFGQAFNEIDIYTATTPSDEYLKSLLSKPTFIALTALDGDEVIGGLAAYVLEKFEQARQEIYIYDLAVAYSHRRQGIATNLIKELQKIAQQIGAYIIYVQADLEDTPAIKLYESLGIGEKVLHFDIPSSRSLPNIH